MNRGVARWIVRLSARLVPRDRRSEWLEEWDGELGALARARAEGVAGVPGPVGFAAGSIPHAVWTRTEGWTVDSVTQDLKYAARVLRRAPGFTAVAAITLALGIGANASIFSLINGLVLRSPAGVESPERLVQIARSYESAPRWDNFSSPAMRLIGTEARALSGVAGYSAESFVLGRGAETERVRGQLVTGNFFEILGVRPHAGRLLQPADDLEPDGHPIAVLGYGLWQRRYAGNPDVVGTTIQLGARPYEVVGVAPEGFAGVETIGTPAGLFVPTMQHPGYGGRLPFASWGTSWISLFGRLADGTTFDEAQASMAVVNVRLREASVENDDMEVLLAQGVGLDPEGRQAARQISLVLMLIVGVVLLITCSNVANLFLARASGRQAEVGVRMAMGAGRFRLVRQLVTESVLIAAIATTLAVPMVFFAGDVLPALFPFALSVSVAADARVYGFLVAIGLSTGLLFGAAPAWAASRRDLAGILREASSTGGRGRSRLRDGLVVAQLGLSLGLVAGAGLLGRSVLNARWADPGYTPVGVNVALIDLFSTGRYDEETGPRFFRELLARAEQIPGVRAATLANSVPITGGHTRASVRPVGRDDVFFEAEYVIVGPGYFETLGIPVNRGRVFGGWDSETEPVVVVNEALAAMFWPGEDPVGKELTRNGTRRVVGVVGDVQMRSLRSRPNPAVYYPADQEYSPRMSLHVAGERGVAADPAALRAIVSSIDPEIPITSVVDLHTAMTTSMGETRTIGYLVGVFAVLALTLAVVGLYGLISFGASQRVREIGIRIALGARPESLVQLLLARGLAIAGLGVAFGLVIAFGLGTALRGLLFGVAHTDAVTLAGAGTLLMVVAAVAAWLPARRASRMDAAISLRD